MTATPAKVEQLKDLAAWFDYAATWLSREVDDSRAVNPVDDDIEADELVEEVAFFRSELNAMLMGFRRASDLLTALATPATTGTHKTRHPARNFRVINGGLKA
jgi:hypothetical protein